MITLDLAQAIAGCERIQRRLAAIANVMDHAGDLMEHWERLMEEGNRRGVLEDRTDKDGNPLLPVTYRPLAAQQRAIYAGTAKPVKLTLEQRLGQHPRRKGRGSSSASVPPVPASTTTSPPPSAAGSMDPRWRRAGRSRESSPRRSVP